MALLSPNYRNDDYQQVPSDLIKQIDELFIPTLENLNVTNPKVLVIFSGGNAVGKSTLAAKLAKNFLGLRIENDNVKRCILRINPLMKPPELNTLTWKYTMNLYSRLESISSNGLIIRDGIIDWYFDRVLPQFVDNNYRLFIISYEISNDKAVELIKARGDTATTTAKRLLDILPDHAIHQKRFRSIYQPDITLTDDSIYDHQLVVDTLAEKLKT